MADTTVDTTKAIDQGEQEAAPNFGVATYTYDQWIALYRCARPHRIFHSGPAHR